MRIAVFSDTHGNKKDMRDALLQFSPLDLILHLGDGVRDGNQVAEEAEIPFRGVSGNEDYGSDLPGKALIDVQGWQFLMTHGHHMDINPYHPEAVWQKDLREMAAWAKGHQAHALLFGHAHRPVLQQENGVILCNPGDQYIGASTGPSFALIEIEAATAHFRIFRKNKAKDWNLLLELKHVRA